MTRRKTSNQVGFFVQHSFRSLIIVQTRFPFDCTRFVSPVSFHWELDFKVNKWFNEKGFQKIGSIPIGICNWHNWYWTNEPLGWKEVFSGNTIYNSWIMDLLMARKIGFFICSICPMSMKREIPRGEESCNLYFQSNNHFLIWFWRDPRLYTL